MAELQLLLSRSKGDATIPSSKNGEHGGHDGPDGALQGPGAGASLTNGPCLHLRHRSRAATRACITQVCL